MSNYIKYGLTYTYCAILLYFFYKLYSFFLYNSIEIINVISLEGIFSLLGMCSVLLLFICLYKITFYKYPDNFYEKEEFNLTNPEYSRENVCYQIYEAMERNPLDLFFDEEICEICLIKKDKSTNHCHACNKCVKNFYFHSKFFGLCFSRENIYNYVLLKLSLAMINYALIYLIFHSTSIEAIQSVSSFSKKESIYTSTYMTTNLYIFVINSSLANLFFVVLLFIIGTLFLQKALGYIICIGYKTTYYNMFRYHKRSVGVIQQRMKLFYNIPEMNLISIKEFFKNLFQK